MAVVCYALRITLNGAREAHLFGPLRGFSRQVGSDLAAIGFFTSKMGIEDLGYKGNSPGKWDGVPEDVLKQYGLEGV